MSSISLKAFVTFKRERVNLPSIRYGASDCIERPGYPRKLIFHIASVPLPGIDKPTLNHGVLALLYGTHDLQEEMRRRRVEARHLSEEIHSADVIVEVGDIKVSHINHDDLKNLRFANIRRMTSSLQSVILQRIEQLHGGFKTETKIEQSKLRMIGRHIALVAELFATDPDFGRIEVLVVPVVDHEIGATRQIALVKPAAIIAEIDQNIDGDILAYRSGEVSQWHNDKLAVIAKKAGYET